MAINGCRECERWKEMKQRLRVTQALDKALTRFDEKVGATEFTPTVAEFIKLMQLEMEYEKELEGEREITVTWVEPGEMLNDE